MKLLCPRCGAAVAGDDIDLAKGLGVCRPCGELVPFGASPTSFGGAHLAELAPRAVYRSPAMTLLERRTEQHYEAIVPPKRLAALPLIGFCLFWDGFMAVWYTIAIAGGLWPMALFGLLHLGVGLFLTHTALVAFFNTRRLVIRDGVVAWTSGPIPTRGNLRLPIDAIDGFAPHAKVGQKTSSYVVALNLGAGTKHDLVVDAPDMPSAEYAADCFQKALMEAKERGAGGPYRS